MILVVQDLHTGGGERIMNSYLSNVKEKCILYSSEECPNPNVINNKIEYWGTFSLLFLALRILFRADAGDTIVVLLSKPIIIFGLLNIIFRKNLYLYEHCDPYLLYFNRSGFMSYLKTNALKLSFKKNKVIVVTELIKRKLVDDLGLKKCNINVLNNPCEEISKKLNNISVENYNLDEVYLIIARDSPEKRISEAIDFYLSEVNTSNTTLWLISDTSRNFTGPDEIFTDYQSVNDYVRTRNIYYKPTLLNFSVAESFSLVIAEFLCSNLRVISAYSDTLAKIWAQYQGFYFIDFLEQADVPKRKYTPITYRTYSKNLKAIIGETSHE